MARIPPGALSAPRGSPIYFIPTMGARKALLCVVIPKVLKTTLNLKSQIGTLGGIPRLGTLWRLSLRYLNPIFNHS